MKVLLINGSPENNGNTFLKWNGESGLTLSEKSVLSFVDDVNTKSRTSSGKDILCVERLAKTEA